MAQDAAVSPVQIGPSGEAYLETVVRRRIDTDVTYYDPTAAAPALETAQTPDIPVENKGQGGAFPRMPFGLVSAAILLAIILVFVRFGGGFMVSLRPDADNPLSTNRDQRARVQSRAKPPRSLNEILKITDRRIALVMLAQNALREAVLANGLLLQQSWTGRDALRRLPHDQSHLGALRDLLGASERVQFGDRDVSEQELAFHIDQITPLFRELSQ